MRIVIKFLNNLITERQFHPLVAKLTNGFLCRNLYEKKENKFSGPYRLLHEGKACKFRMMKDES